MLIGCTCNQPQRLLDALAPVRDALVAEPPISRWGLGYVHSGEVLLSVNPRASDTPVDLYAALEKVRSDYVIAHTSDDDGFSGPKNTGPFRFRKWMFAAESALEDFSGLKEALRDHIPEFLARNIRGHSPAEHLFHLFLAFVRDNGNIDDPNLPADAIRRALHDSLAVVDGLLSQQGVDGNFGNIILSNSRAMHAVRLEAPFFMRRLKVSARQEVDQFRGILAVSGNHQPGEGFELIPESHVLSISRELEVEFSSLDG